MQSLHPKIFFKEEGLRFSYVDSDSDAVTICESSDLVTALQDAMAADVNPLVIQVEVSNDLGESF